MAQTMNKEARQLNVEVGYEGPIYDKSRQYMVRFVRIPGTDLRILISENSPGGVHGFILNVELHVWDPYTKTGRWTRVPTTPWLESSILLRGETVPVIFPWISKDAVHFETALLYIQQFITEVFE